MKNNTFFILSTFFIFAYLGCNIEHTNSKKNTHLTETKSIQSPKSLESKGSNSNENRNFSTEVIVFLHYKSIYDVFNDTLVRNKWFTIHDYYPNWDFDIIDSSRNNTERLLSGEANFEVDGQCGLTFDVKINKTKSTCVLYFRDIDCRRTKNNIAVDFNSIGLKKGDEFAKMILINDSTLSFDYLNPEIEKRLNEYLVGSNPKKEIVLHKKFHARGPKTYTISH